MKDRIVSGLCVRGGPSSAGFFTIGAYGDVQNLGHWSFSEYVCNDRDIQVDNKDTILSDLLFQFEHPDQRNGKTGRITLEKARELGVTDEMIRKYITAVLPGSVGSIDSFLLPSKGGGKRRNRKSHKQNNRKHKQYKQRRSTRK